MNSLKGTQHDVSDFPILTIFWEERESHELKLEGNRQTPAVRQFSPVIQWR